MDYITQLMTSLGLNQPQQNPGIQAYQNMLGGNHFGGVIPQGGGGQAMFRQTPPQDGQQQNNKMSFGDSPWPGVWGI